MTTFTKSTFTQEKPGQIQRFCEECQIEFWCYPGRVGKYCSFGCSHKGRGKGRKLKERTDPQVCTKCKKSYPLAEYGKDNGVIALRCDPCRQPTPEQKRRSHLWTKFKMTLEDWISLYNCQDGKCPVCTKALPKLEEMDIVSRDTKWAHRDWNTDHCHKTGKVRGITCRQCNMGLGSFKDSPEIMRSAADYIEKHRVLTH